MDRFILLSAVAILSIALQTNAQDKPVVGKSQWLEPADTVRGGVDKDVSIKVTYSQPLGSVEFLPYGKVWRFGAHQSTTIEFGWMGADVEGHHLPKGKYGLYAIPGEKEWVFIFNSVWEGDALDYTNNAAASSKTEVLRITVKPEKAAAYNKKFKFVIQSSGGPGKVYFVWGDVMAGFNVR